MTTLSVFIVRPVARLTPRYDREANVLEVSTPGPLYDVPYGPNVNGCIIFDLNADRVLVNFDVLIPRIRWRHSDAHWSWSAEAPAVSLGFTEPTVRLKSFHLPLELRYSEHTESLSIFFGRPSGAENAFSLSRSCLAFVAGTRLAGFLIRVAP